MLRSPLAFLNGGSSAFSLPPTPLRPSPQRCFRSQASLNSIRAHSRTAEDAARSHLVLYNYPSFSGAFSALFAHLFHCRLRLPFLVLPFSSVEPFRVKDFEDGAFEMCYLLDFVGPKSFAVEMSQIIPRVIAFDHRETTLRKILQGGDCSDNLELRIDTKKSSARAVYDYFSEKLSGMKCSQMSDLELVEMMSNFRILTGLIRQDQITNLLNEEDVDRVETVLRYLEDVDLRQWRMPNIKTFNIGLREERSKLNCITNPYVFEQLLQFNSSDLIAKGNSYTYSRKDAASKLLGKAFKIRLGRGLYGECLAVRADGNSHLSHEIGIELSRRSAAAGLRPIGAVVFMQQRNLKMCLRSEDSATDTSEIAKAYGGGGNFSSSSFIIRMDEYNHWTSANSL
ncbi:hypothetical protein Cni_G24313 [Canna indica]|uniref:Uncharacterized protein n=1 Tax=Canna indica TaxID=4628 RepID=A0AAQ3KXT1_9LILI|nr:hypothetical protein Cni_G24313 [Canna indica]